MHIVHTVVLKLLGHSRHASDIKANWFSLWTFRQNRTNIHLRDMMAELIFFISQTSWHDCLQVVQVKTHSIFTSLFFVNTFKMNQSFVRLLRDIWTFPFKSLLMHQMLNFVNLCCNHCCFCSCSYSWFPHCFFRSHIPQAQHVNKLQYASAVSLFKFMQH